MFSPLIRGKGTFLNAEVLDMESLQEILAQLPARHRAALQWFIENAGKEQPWPDPLTDGPFLATRAKGIYKPKGWKYALSVRQVLHGPYPDRDLKFRSDGTWSYSYFQENRSPSDRDTAYTNRGLLACQQDKVPVGVMLQTSSKPKALYKILGVALVADWEKGYFLLEGFAPDGHSHI